MGTITIKRTIITALAGAAMTAAAGAPAASGMPMDPLGVHGGSQQPGAPPSSTASAPDERPAAVEPVVADGFDVPSAAIGAAGAGLLVIVVAAGGLAWRRPGTSRRPPASA